MISNLIDKINSFNTKRDSHNRQNLMEAFQGVTPELKEQYSELLNYAIRILSLPYNSNLKSIESDIAISNYSFNDKILSTKQIEVLRYFKETSGRKEAWVNAPTSWGKTLLSRAIIKNNSYHKIAFIVPSIFLMNELFDKMKYDDEFDGNIKIFPEMEIADKFIHILTPERFLQSQQKYDFIIYDEFYKVSDNQSKIKNEFENNSRGFKFRKAFKKARDSKSDLLLLSPWIKINSNNNWYKNYMSKIKLFDFVNPISYSNTFQEFYEFNDGFEEFIKQEKEGVSLIFSDSYNRLKKIGEHLIDILPELTEPNPIKNLFRNESSFHKSLLSKLIDRGVLVIGASLPRFLLMEIAHNIRKNNNIKYILSTSSISEGVNLPIQNIYIDKLNPNATSFDIINLAGRAGRYKDIFNIEKGYIYLSKEINDKKNKENDFTLILEEELQNKRKLDKKKRKKQESYNKALNKLNLLNKENNLIQPLEHNKKEDIFKDAIKLSKINKEKLKELVDQLHSVSDFMKQANILKNIEIYCEITKMIRGISVYSNKQITSFARIISNGIYSFQIRALSNMKNIALLNTIRFKLSNEIIVIDSLLRNIHNIEGKSFGIYLSNFAASKIRSIQNDFGLPKDLKKRDPFIKKYETIIDEMMKK